MGTLLARVRFVVGTLMLVTLFAFTPPVASAQQQNPKNWTDPTSSIVTEDQLLQKFKEVKGRGTIPDVKSYLIEHPAGRDWRRFHEVTLRWIGAVAILGALLGLTVFYLWRGMVRIASGRSGVKIVRFNAFERFVHWMTATCFILLAITGLNITFGKPLLLPVMGPEAFSAWSQWAKYAHNFLSFPFTLGVITIFLMWIGGNIPNRVDIEWLRQGFGGIATPGKHPPAYRFNAGQKGIYWIVVLGGVAVTASGYVLLFPFYGTDIDRMQDAEMVHAIIAMLFIAAMLGHIYIGTIGMEGAFEAMGTGTVDINWAKEHHALWLEEEQAYTGLGEPQIQPAAKTAD
jgi:formate dehydrogenase subunit gamma